MDDSSFESTMLSSGLLDESALSVCRATRDEAREHGVELRLAQIAIQRGLVTAEQVKEVAGNGADDDEEVGTMLESSDFIVEGGTVSLGDSADEPIPASEIHTQIEVAAEPESDPAIVAELVGAGAAVAPEPESEPVMTAELVQPAQDAGGSGGARTWNPGKGAPSASPQAADVPTREQSDEALIGQTIGHYRLEAILGRGTRATVYRARQPSLEREVAVKVLTQQACADEEYVQRFHREARAAAAFRHANVVQVIDTGRQDVGGRAVHYFVMELITGKSLSDIIKARGALAEVQALRITRAMLDALANAHDKRYVHRDIKPENVIIADGGMPKLADLGLAKDTLGQNDLTKDGLVMGTPNYMAPEQATGAENLDGRTDIYALGISLYEMLTGHLPFEHESAIVVLQMRVNNEVPSPKAERADLSPLTCAVVARMTRRNRDERYANAREAMADVERAIAALEAPPRPTPAAQPAAPPPGATPAPMTPAPMAQPMPTPQMGGWPAGQPMPGMPVQTPGPMPIPGMPTPAPQPAVGVYPTGVQMPVGAYPPGVIPTGMPMPGYPGMIASSSFLLPTPGAPGAPTMTPQPMPQVPQQPAPAKPEAPKARRSPGTGRRIGTGSKRPGSIRPATRGTGERPRATATRTAVRARQGGWSGLMIGGAIGAVIATGLLAYLIGKSDSGRDPGQTDPGVSRPGRSDRPAVEDDRPRWLVSLEKAVERSMREDKHEVAFAEIATQKQLHADDAEALAEIATLSTRLVNGLETRVDELIAKNQFRLARTRADALKKASGLEASDRADVLIAKIERAAKNAEGGALGDLAKVVPAACLEGNFDKAAAAIDSAPLITGGAKDLEKQLRELVETARELGRSAGFGQSTPPTVGEALGKAGLSLGMEPGLGMGPLAPADQVVKADGKPVWASSSAPPSDEELEQAKVIGFVLGKPEVVAMVRSLGGKELGPLYEKMDGIKSHYEIGAARVRLGRAVSRLLDPDASREETYTDLLGGVWNEKELGEDGVKRLAAVKALAKVVNAWDKGRWKEASNAGGELSAHREALWPAEQAAGVAYGLLATFVEKAQAGDAKVLAEAIDLARLVTEQAREQDPERAPSTFESEFGTFTSQAAAHANAIANLREAALELSRALEKAGAKGKPSLEVADRSAADALAALETTLPEGGSKAPSLYAKRVKPDVECARLYCKAVRALHAGQTSLAGDHFRNIDKSDEDKRFATRFERETKSLARALAEVGKRGGAAPPDRTPPAGGGGEEEPDPEVDPATPAGGDAPAVPTDVILVDEREDLRPFKSSSNWVWGEKKTGLGNQAEGVRDFLSDPLVFPHTGQLVKRVEIKVRVEELLPNPSKPIVAVTADGVTGFLSQDKLAARAGPPDEYLFTSSAAFLARTQREQQIAVQSLRVKRKNSYTFFLEFRAKDPGDPSKGYEVEVDARRGTTRSGQQVILPLERRPHESATGELEIRLLAPFKIVEIKIELEK